MNPCCNLLPLPYNLTRFITHRDPHVNPHSYCLCISERINGRDCTGNRELQSAGYGIDIVEMKSVISLKGYQAFIIGGPLYIRKAVGNEGSSGGDTVMP
jgi:hypothetical protein